MATAFACGGETATSSDSAAVSEQESALEGAQGSYEVSREQADACFATFRACVDEGGDQESCRAALKACLPEAPPGPRACGGRGGKPGERPDGGPPPPPRGEHDPACDGGARPPPPPPGERGDGGARPPRPEGAEGAGRPGPGGPGGPGRPGGHCGPPPFGVPARAELRACHEALETCLASGTAREQCATEDRACVRAAFTAAFAALCEKAAAACSAGDAPAEPCARITERCAAGVASGEPAAL